VVRGTSTKRQPSYSGSTLADVRERMCAFSHTTPKSFNDLGGVIEPGYI